MLMSTGDRMSTPKQKLYQAVIVSELLEKPLRSGDLWRAVRSRVRSKEQFMNNIHILIKAGVIERLKKSHKHVSYRVSAQPSEIVSFARRIRSGSTELLWDVINYLAHSNIFEGQEEAVEAAIDFWTVRYRNTCVLTALFSLAEPIDSGEGGKRSSPLKIRESRHARRNGASRRPTPAAPPASSTARRLRAGSVRPGSRGCQRAPARKPWSAKKERRT